MNKKDIRKLEDAFGPAAKIGRELFAIGDEPNSPTNRIEFKGNKMGNECGRGGMCEAAMIDWMARALARHELAIHKAKKG